MKKVKLIVELAFIFLLPLLFIALTCSIKTVKEYDENNNEINKESYIESSYPFSDFKSNDHVINYLNYNQLFNTNDRTIVQNGITVDIVNNEFHAYGTSTDYTVILITYLQKPNGYYYNDYGIKSISNQYRIGDFNNGSSISTVNNYSYYYSNNYMALELEVQNDTTIDLNFHFNIINVNQLLYNDLPDNSIDINTIINDLNISDRNEYVESEIFEYYTENSIISGKWQYNYSPWGSFIHLVIDYLYLADTPLLRILLMYFIMFMIMFLLWHVVYLPIDWIVHLGTKPLKE